MFSSPTASARPWFAAIIALALMLSLAAVVAPAIATNEPDGTVEFINPPVAPFGDPPDDLLLADENGVAEFVVEVDGDFSVDATELVAGVTGIDVLVELRAGDTAVVSGTRELTANEEGGVPTATVPLDLSEVDTGEYTVHATATTQPAGTELGTAYLEVAYLPNATVCDGDCEVEVTNDDGFTATVALLGGGLVNLELPATSPYLLDPEACPGDHTRLPAAVLFDILVGDQGAETAEITVDLTRRARQLETNNGISQYQFCYIGGAEFDDRAGNEAAFAPDGYPGYPKLQYGPALLPECSANGEVAPCVLDRRSRGGGAQFTFLVPTGDPMFR